VFLLIINTRVFDRVPLTVWNLTTAKSIVKKFIPGFSTNDDIFRRISDFRLNHPIFQSFIHSDSNTHPGLYVLEKKV
jgi:hypothetical protein